jgi:hypothetical protein
VSSALTPSRTRSAVRAALLVLASAALIGAIVFLRPKPTPGPPMRDFEASYAAGQTWAQGSDPYGAGIWHAERNLGGAASARFEVLPFVGPPALLPFLFALSRLPFAAANAVWRTLLIAALAALALLTARWTQRRPDAWAFLAASIALLGFGPATSALALGQTALPACVFGALAVFFLESRGAWAAALGAAAWMQPNVAVPMLGASRGIKAWAPTALGAAAFGAICLATAGVRGIAAYIATLSAHGAAERFDTIQMTPASIAYGFGAAPHAAAILGISSAAAAAAIWISAARRMTGALSRFCIGCTLLPFLMPFFHEQDLIVLFVPAVFCVVNAQRRFAPAAFAGALCCAADWLGLAQRPDGAAQTLLLVGAAAIALMLLRGAVEMPSMFACGAVLIGIALAALAAQHDPAPIWPDAMRALPAAVRTLPVAQIWHAEQRATGLLVPNAFWAALRCMPLLGAALLAFVCAHPRAITCPRS